MKKYQVIYADPPWDFRGYDLKAGARYVGNKYPVQSKSWIEGLPIGDLAAADCVLFLWVTYPKLNEVFDLFPRWGFTYKTVAFTWVKRNRRAPTWFWGMGRWTRANAEVCLLATRGSPKRLSAAVHSVIDTPIEAHSKKPDETRKRIVALMGDLPRIELFARERTPGWDAWGNEVESDATLAA